MWPPEWYVSDQGAGEEGVLAEVQLRTDRTPKFISLVANHLGDSRTGIIMLEDSAHLEILYQKLKENLGKPLSEIGDMEIELMRQPSPYGLRQVRPNFSLYNLNRISNRK